MGNPIAHSLSPQIHGYFAEQTQRSLIYDKTLVDEDSFEACVLAFFSQGGRGLNVTQPFKERAFLMSDVRTVRCMEAQSANTLWMNDGYLNADNTDGVGLLRDLACHMTLSGARVLLMGAGGAARGVLGPLIAANAQVTLTNRTAEKARCLQRAFGDATQWVAWEAHHQGYDLILNATSMSLQGGSVDVPLSWLVAHPLCYDLAYHVSGVTPFVAWARAAGCVAHDGFGMLVEQAAEAFFIWHGIPAPSTNRIQLKKACIAAAFDKVS